MIELVALSLVSVRRNSFGNLITMPLFVGAQRLREGCP